MQGSLKVEDAARFFFENRRDKFSNWSWEDTVASIHKAIEDKVFAWSCDSSGQLSGIAIGVRQPETIHIAAIILKKPARLKDFIRLFRRHYAGFMLTGNRENKLVDYRRIYGRSIST